jgi:hypothetical protein
VEYELEAAAMIPRYQRSLFWTLLLASVAMAIVLIRFRELAADRIAGHPDAGAESQPLPETVAAPEETVTLLEADDLDDGIAAVTRQMPLPTEPGARARVLLRNLLADYALPQSKHQLPASHEPEGGVAEVFFMTALPNGKTREGAGHQTEQAGQAAVVNLTRSFVDNHPSGIEVESLTLLSIVGTLHANFPAVTEVLFLVDGQPRETLAGHSDLRRVYLASGWAAP